MSKKLLVDDADVAPHSITSFFGQEAQYIDVYIGCVLKNLPSTHMMVKICPFYGVRFTSSCLDLKYSNTHNLAVLLNFVVKFCQIT